MSRRLLLVPICAAAALSCRPAPLPDPNFGGLEHGRRTLDLRNDVQLLELTNGKNSVKEIIKQSRLGSFEVSKMLYRLLNVRLVRRKVAPVAVSQ